MSRRYQFWSAGVVMLALAGALSSGGLAAPTAGTNPPAPPPADKIADARALSRTFAQVAATVSPSVVRISVTKGGKVKSIDPFGGGGDSPKQRGMGSGVVIDSAGHILTNNHVVEGALDVRVTFDNGKTIIGKVIGTDPKSDLAVVKVEGVQVKPATLGDSDKLAVGDWVIAIGNPFGLDHTVTVGVLSARGRSGFQSGQYEDFLQTDASINPGNSGGPLVNLDGEIVGINTMIAGIGTGIGFSVPTSMAKPIAESLIRDGKVRRPYLGILMQDVTPEIQLSLGKGAPGKGALVTEVVTGLPAERAGLVAGDVIMTVDGAVVDGSKGMQRAILGKKIGQKVLLAVWRDGKPLTLQAATAEMPGDDDDDSGAIGNQSPQKPQRTLGIDLTTLTPNMAGRLGLAKTMKGAVITGVDEDSDAAEAGIRPGDVVVEVDRKAITNAKEAASALSAARAGGHLLRLRRGASVRFLVLPESAN